MSYSEAVEFAHSASNQFQRPHLVRWMQGAGWRVRDYTTGERLFSGPRADVVIWPIRKVQA